MVPPKWNDRNEILDILLNIRAEIGIFPSSEILKSVGFGGMVSAIHRRHGGMNSFRKELNELLPSKPYGYYSNIDIVKQYIEVASEELGREPSIIELDQMFPGIKYGIRRYHGGYRMLKDSLGMSQFCAPIGYWDDPKRVKQEIKNILDVIQYFPGYIEILTLGPRGLYTGVLNCFGTLDECRKVMNYPLNTKSKLETRVKMILNRWVDSIDYIDNGRSVLRKRFGLTLLHPITRNPLELDRLYYSKKLVAIEVQGVQHKYGMRRFSNKTEVQEKLALLQEVDRSKKEQCETQGVVLIEIGDTDLEEDILKKIKGVLPIRLEPLEMEYLSYGPEQYREEEPAKRALLELITRFPDRWFTSNLVKHEHPELYTAIKAYHGGINGARALIGLKTIRETRDSWTVEKTWCTYHQLKETLGPHPMKKDAEAYTRGLYYAIQKHGGLGYFATLEGPM